MIAQTKQLIESCFEVATPPKDVLPAVEQVIEWLDNGQVSVVSRTDAGDWEVHEWVKKAILLYFRLRPIVKMEEGPFFDKVPLKDLSGGAHRIVPFSSVRKGSFIAPKVVIMAPAFVNIGAYIDEGSMVDSLVLVGSCARIGKNVHLGAGTVIGGVLEPPNSRPVIIEDNAFVGGNCGIFEGCIVEENAVIGAGTLITGGTPIIDVESGQEFRGRVPANAVVVPGARRKKGSDQFMLNTPLIIKRRDPNISAKLALEESLRTF